MIHFLIPRNSTLIYYSCRRKVPVSRDIEVRFADRTLLGQQAARGQRVQQQHHKNEDISTTTHYIKERMIEQVYKTHMNTPKALKKP